MRVDKEIHFLKGPSPDSKLILSIRRDFRESLRWRKMLFIVELTKITHENSENIDYSNGPISKQHTIVFFLSLLQKGGYLHSPNMRHLKIGERYKFSAPMKSQQEMEMKKKDIEDKLKKLDGPVQTGGRPRNGIGKCSYRINV